jgi:hypothetical protein
MNVFGRVFLGVGVSLIIVGFATLSIPAGLIVGGVLISAVALFLTDGN